MTDRARFLLSLSAAGTALAACCSCVPGSGAAPFRVTVAVPDPDRSLLRQLSLADPFGKPAIGTPLGSPFTAAPPFLAALGTDDGRRAMDCLTAAVYYEARSEPLDGQRAVAQVVLNRVRDRAFPASVCGVVYQRSARTCQFTFACDGSTDQAIQPRAWAIARQVAASALDGAVYAPVGGATHYHANYVSPWWAPSLTRIGAVGQHVFYRWKSGLADALTFRQAYAGHEAEMSIAPASIAGMAGAEHGVTVHRGGTDDLAANDVVAGEAPAAVTAGVTVHIGGVRVHHGAGEAIAADTLAAAGGAPASVATPAP